MIDDFDSLLIGLFVTVSILVFWYKTGFFKNYHRIAFSVFFSLYLNLNVWGFVFIEDFCSLLVPRLVVDGSFLCLYLVAFADVIKENLRLVLYILIFYLAVSPFIRWHLTGQYYVLKESKVNDYGL